MPLSVEVERETDGRWIAEIPALPGALAYGPSRDEAISLVQALALRILADRLGISKHTGLKPGDL